MRIGFDIGRPTRSELLILLEALVNLNVLYLIKNPGAPNLYKTDIRYKREPSRNRTGAEDWRTIPELLETGAGDCEDLTAYMVAWLRVVKKTRAVPWLRKKGKKWHVLVRLPGGQLEDPSRALGMGGK